jgi:hypothetical protein
MTHRGLSYRGMTAPAPVASGSSPLGPGPAGSHWFSPLGRASAAADDEPSAGGFLEPNVSSRSDGRRFAVPENEKTPPEGGFRKERLKGLEPSTFCMAIGR